MISSGSTRCDLWSAYYSVSGFIMAEQIKSVDSRTREVKRIESGGKELLTEALSVLDACIY